MTSAVLERVVRHGLCSGCGACAALSGSSLAMDMVAPGFLRPRATKPLPTEFDDRFRRVCPGLGLTLQADARQDHALWGPFLSMRTGHSTDKTLRHQASSGGALSAILTYLLESGVTEGILQTTSSADLPIANTSVISRSAADIFAAAGSRYAPSAPLEGINDHLGKGARLAFVGKPCDVAALRALARFDPRVDATFPVMISFFCAGVPSLAGARQVLSELGVNEADVAAFRYRGDGWPGFARATLNDGTTRQMTYAESWGGILSDHVQTRCKLCPDGTGSFADIVCADAWDADENGYPVFSEGDGISLIVSRTFLGEKIVTDAMSDGAITASPFNPDNLAAIQPGQTGRRRSLLARLAALRLLMRPAPAYVGFHLWRNAGSAGLLRNLKTFLGTARRTVQGRFRE